MTDQTTLASILDDRRRLETFLQRDPTNFKAHELMEKLRSFLLPDPELNQQLKRLELREKALVLLTVPEFLEIESTTRCNINPPCIMCHTRMFRSSDRDIDRVVLAKIKEYTRYAKTVSLHGGGEPLMVPNLFDTVEHIDPSKTMVIFSSNGLLLTENHCAEIIDRGVGYVNFSLDAARPETYDKIRHCDFVSVINNLKRLTRIKKARGSSLPKFCLSMVIMKENIEETVEFVELAHDVGADYVEFMKLGSLPESQYYRTTYKEFVFDYRAQMLESIPEIHNDWMQKAYRRATELGLTFRYEGWLNDEESMYLSNIPQEVRESGECRVEKPQTLSILCEKPWTGALVLMNGNVIPCCNLPAQVLGSLKEQSFDEVWNGQRAQEIRAVMLEDPLPEICRDCHVYKARRIDPSVHSERERI